MKKEEGAKPAFVKRLEACLAGGLVDRPASKRNYNRTRKKEVLGGRRSATVGGERTNCRVGEAA
ncbi:hypothetical protein KSP40_PGU019947 [Platanthera guangdongensis]|uniref:Uncharacterized protein n=1 Tax=Platanthera guangdongensis TaxID=2320717 RepID=A0ABR2N3L0_9ASPA